MSRRLQFSLKMLLVAAAVFAISAAEFRLLGGVIDDLKALGLIAIFAILAAEICAAGWLLLLALKTTSTAVARVLMQTRRRT